MEKRQIGTTELRQKLTDVIQAVKEEKAVYVVETFGRPQVVILDVDVYESLQRRGESAGPLDELARSAFGMWRDREDIDEEWLTRGRERWASAWQEAEDDAA